MTDLDPITAEKPLAIDLFCGLGGWTEGLLAEGFDVVGFDNQRHEYGEHRYPAQLVLQDVLTLHGRQFKDASLIVASPPCQEYSHMAMPWVRARRTAAALRGEGDSTPYTYPDGRVLRFDADGFPLGYTGSRTIAELNEPFDACFRIQREASEAAGRHVPMVVENVVGAQKWVGRARWRYGSYYLWGDVPALLPIVTASRMKYSGPRLNDGVKVGGLDWSSDDKAKRGCFRDSAIKNSGGSWFRVAHNTTSGKGWNPVSSKSQKRKAASAMIAKIPFELARHIASVYA